MVSNQSKFIDIYSKWYSIPSFFIFLILISERKNTLEVDSHFLSLSYFFFINLYGGTFAPKLVCSKSQIKKWENSEFFKAWREVRCQLIMHYSPALKINIITIIDKNSRKYCQESEEILKNIEKKNRIFGKLELAFNFFFNIWPLF